ncbi:hypothetical protein GCM10009530_66270 [Microbispora corallina]|uniref:Uncharacterized protein n=1 Tax=Microbispora corallina TaxID=83302 RepID=A0ABQ4G9I5_9ACTN|nr:hypothetical protein [Microbispora corallina]GIH43686.1 hypothetical protein Mco01_66860 [Microbispora corallina]
MLDPEDPREETGPLVRPYIPVGGRYGSEADRFWSEELDDAAVSRRAADHAPRGGDLLSEDWTPDDAGGHDDGPGRRPDDRARPDDAGPRDLDDDLDRDDDVDGAPQDASYEDDSYESYESYEDDGGPATDQDVMRSAWHDREDGGSGGGFLGAGWRNSPDDPEEVEESRRRGVLVRAGVAAVAVLGVIWALTAWVGQPSASSCPSGPGCAAEAPAPPVASPSPVESGPSAEPGPTESVAADPDVTPSAPPKASPQAPRPRTTAPTSRASATHRATTSPTHVPTSQPPVSAEDPSEPTPDPVTSAPAQPTSAPAPTQDPPKHNGGLFGWLF